jgi:Domain of unknown function (DUF4340)
MNRKQFIILLVLVALVGAAGWIVHQRGQQSWQSSGQTAGGKLLPNLPVNDIAQMTIQSGTNELTLAKRDNLWRVQQRGGYPADFSKISSLLMKLSDLKIVQSEDAGPSELGRFDLQPPGAATNSGTRLAFNDAKGKTLASVLLGKKHMKQPSGNSQFDEGWPDGRYVMAGTGAKTVAVISDPLDDVEPNPQSWLDKDFFHIEKPRAVSVQFPQATNSWKLVRASETNDWQLADAKPGEKLDSSKLYEVTRPFSSPSFDDVSPGVSQFTNATVLTARTFDGFDYTVKIGQKQSDDFPVTLAVAAKLPTEPAPPKDAKPAEKTKLDAAFQQQHQQLADKLAKEKQLENWTYLVPSYVVEEVLKPRDELLTTNSAPPLASKNSK